MNREIHVPLREGLEVGFLRATVRPAKAGVFSRSSKPAGAKIRSPVAWIAGWRETKTLKPIDNRLLGGRASHRAVTTVNVMWPRKGDEPRAEPPVDGRRQHA
jgi:hypothetical protein